MNSYYGKLINNEEFVLDFFEYLFDSYFFVVELDFDEVLVVFDAADKIVTKSPSSNPNPLLTTSA